ncbi:MAG: TIGR03619 family F420-dependent LLM class oxidoreductase [Acidimicrobiia bacterium]
MQGWLMAGSVEVEHLVPMAVAAQEAGFGGIALGDHLVFPQQISSPYPYTSDGSIKWEPETPWPDPWVTIAAMATATTTLRFTTAVYIAPLRDPISLAKLTSTASILSRGRMSCGFGTGWMSEEFELVGQQFAQRGRRFDEMLEVLRLLWTGEMVEYHGQHYDFAPVQMSPAAFGGRIPVLLGGNTPQAMERAVRHDGWIGVHRDVDTTAERVERLRSLRAASARAEEPFEIATVVLRGARAALPLQELGVDTAIIPVLGLGVGPDLASRIDAVHRFGDEMIERGP